MLPLAQDGLCPAVIGIGWRDVAEALMVAAVVVMLDEGCHLAFKVAGQVIVFE
jgi:hypothetical protein